MLFVFLLNVILRIIVSCFQGILYLTATIEPFVTNRDKINPFFYYDAVARDFDSALYQR